MKLFTLSFLLTATLGAHEARAQPLSADTTGEARAAAMRVLKELPPRVSTIPSHSPFFVTDRAVLESATLGEPFVCYFPDSTFLTHYDSAKAGDILRYLQKSVFFPVSGSGRVLGTINVIQEGQSGVWKLSTMTIGDKVVRSIEDSRRSAVVGAGQRVSILDTGFAGAFAAVDDGVNVYHMMPLNKGTHRMVEEVMAPDVEDSWIPAERVFPIIKAKVRATRDSEHLHQPVDDH